MQTTLIKFHFRLQVCVARKSRKERIVIDLMISFAVTYILKAKEQELTIGYTIWKIEVFEYIFLMFSKNARSVKYDKNQLKVLSQKTIAFTFTKYMFHRW